IGGLETAAVHPDPAFGANPFGARFDVVVPAGNDHGDVVRVGEFNAVFRAGVPQRVRRGKLAVAFNLRGAGEVGVHAPVRDVAVVANPVEQLAAAGVVIPTPVHVHALFDVRFHG